MKYKSGEALIEVLNELGIDKIFLNPGFEYVGAIGNVAAARVEGKKSPQLVLCLDEAVTAAAAYGNYMITGKPQLVMVHSELGTLQLGGNVQSLQWGRTPVLILAGYRTPDLSRTVWNGQPYDQGGIVRNSVKFDRVVKGDEDIHTALLDAFRIACTEPTGPVYLSIPMDYLDMEIEKPDTLPVVKEPENLPPVDTDMLKKMAHILLEAKSPLLVSGHAGRYNKNVDALVILAETLGASVLTGYSWMNFPNNHPLCVGIEQIGGSRSKDACYDEADVILAIDYDMPYVANALPPKPETKILHIDTDPLTQGRLLWGRGADFFMKADSRDAIPALTKMLTDNITAEKKAEFEERFARIAAGNNEKRKEWHENGIKLSGNDPISADYLFSCLNQVIDEDSIIVNHSLSYCASVTEQIVRTKPGTWFGCPSGAIGWAPGAALGAAAASPGKLVVSIVSDGGFVWGCPTSFIWTAANYNFPFLTIICNNKGYGAIRDTHLHKLGGDNITEQLISEAAMNFQPDYSTIARGAGGFGRTVRKSEEVLPALKEALDAVRSGNPAVLDVHLIKGYYCP